jgi:hypothetical protein
MTEAERLRKQLAEERQASKSLMLSHEQELDQLKLEHQQQIYLIKRLN